VTAAMLQHVINPPGRPLAGVLRTRPEDSGRGAHVVDIGTIVDDVTGTCDEFVGSDVTHTAEVDAVATVLHACSVVHLIAPDRQAQLRNSVIQRLYSTPTFLSQQHPRQKQTITAPTDFYPVPDTSGDRVLFSIDFFVCLSVYIFVYIFLCFFVSKITRKRLDRFA